MNLPASIQPRVGQLLRVITYHNNQAEGATRELSGLLKGSDETEHPLVIFGNGEYANTVEAQPQRKAK